MASLIWLTVIGAAAGLVATKLMRVNIGLLPTIALGVVGALIGGMMIRMLVSSIGGLIGAVAGACLLIWLAKRYGSR
jgi:uncharacterized membrane protein YeaQ/YmgE (transglycosylase-associated protein family)